MSFIDLHVHTTASDGTFSPEETVRIAAQSGIHTIAVTDHDTFAGVSSAQEEGARCGVEVLTGIELSVDHRGVDTHMLGYLYNPEDPGLTDLLRRDREEKTARNRKMCAALTELGCPVDYDTLAAKHPGAVIGRPHITQEIIANGWATDTRTAFLKYLAEGAPCYVPRALPSLAEGVRILLQAGGIPVLAHPFQYGWSEAELEELVRFAAESGVKGIEVYYYNYTEEDRARLLVLAEKYSLFPTGGSDFHGAIKPNPLGGPEVPEVCLAALKAAKSAQ